MFIDPVAVRIGPLQVHWYGIIIATAVLIGGVIGTMEARRRGEDPDKGWSLLLPTIVLAVIGARIYHVIHEWDFYRENIALIPQVWNGGIGIPGAVMGGALAIALYTRWAKLPTWRWLDIFAPALLLGQVIGRLGNFVLQLGDDAVGAYPRRRTLPHVLYEFGLSVVHKSVLIRGLCH